MAVERRPDSSNRRIVLLAGQAFALGLMAAWIAIPASAIFLETYGSGLLPLTYIGAAIAGAATSAALAVAVRRRPLVAVAVRVLAFVAIALLVSWLLLWTLGADWLSFGLLVLVPIVVPVGFMLIVAQAGMLLDVRALKSLYGRVIAGFALGFVAGGIAGPTLIEVLGSTEHLLAGGAGAAGLFMLLVTITRRNFTAELSGVDIEDSEIDRPTLRSLLRHRYVALIVGFQMLSAMESQWLDFLVFDRAGKRYTDTDDLATFISRFVAIAYGADIVFLLLLAGVLMSRFGLRYGLTANPIVVLVLLGTMITASALQGSIATNVFVLVVATRVSDLVLADGAARTSLSAAYQAVPTRVRLSAQAAIEGLAVPVAIGVSGALLMVLRATIGTDGMALPIATSLVVVAWTVVAFFVYRDYRVNLLANLRHRALDPSELAIEGSSTLEAIHRLVDSPDERDVRLGLDTLTATGHEDLHACLLSLATDDRASVRSDVLDRLVSVDPIAAASAARRGLVDPNPEVRAASVRTLGLVGRAADLDSISARLEDPSAEVQVAAVTSMFELGGDAASARVSLEVEALVGHESSEGLIVAARMLGACDHGASIDRSLLSTLLSAADHDLVNAALRAIRWPDDAGALHDVMRHLDHRSTAEAAVDALARSGDTALSLADEGLRGNFHLGQHGCEQLARVCRVTGGSKAADVLRRHVEHRDREVGLAVMNALAVIVTGMTTSEESVLRADLEHACHVVRAIVTLEHSPGAGALREALRDELDLLRRRVLAVLSIHHGVGELNTVGFQLAQQSTNLHSIAMEWLDVTLVGIERPSLALLEPRASLADRHASLTRWFPLPSISPETVLIDVVEDPDDRWRRPWLTACALLAGADSPELGLEHLAETLRESPVEEHRHHWHIVSDTIAGIRRRRSLEAA